MLGLRNEGQLDGAEGLAAYAYDRLRQATSDAQARLRNEVLNGTDTNRGKLILEFLRSTRSEDNAKIHVFKRSSNTC